MGVVQGSQQLGLTLEPGEALGIEGELLGQQLDGDFAIEDRVAGAIHLAHSTLPEGREDLAVTE